jgi:hypothetical protein
MLYNNKMVKIYQYFIKNLKINNAFYSYNFVIQHQKNMQKYFLKHFGFFIVILCKIIS